MSTRAGTRTQCTHCAYKGIPNHNGRLYAHHRRVLDPDGRTVRTQPVQCPGGAPATDTRRDLMCRICGATETVGPDGIMPAHRQLIVTRDGISRSDITCDGGGLRVIGTTPTGVGPGRKTAYGCGTPQARIRHRRHQEDCALCEVTYSIPTVPPACGTDEAFLLHRRRHEHCDPCWAARTRRLAKRRLTKDRDYRARTLEARHAQRRNAFRAGLRKAAGDG